MKFGATLPFNYRVKSSVNVKGGTKVVDTNIQEGETSNVQFLNPKGSTLFDVL